MSEKTDKRTINGKSLSQIMAELCHPFDKKDLKENFEYYIYVEPHVVIERLINVLGFNYDIVVTKYDHFFKIIPCKIKEKRNSKKEVIEPARIDNIEHVNYNVSVDLIIYDDNGVKVTKRSGTGSETNKGLISSNENVDSTFKGAYSSALKIAAKNYGIGLGLWFPKKDRQLNLKCINDKLIEEITELKAVITNSGHTLDIVRNGIENEFGLKTLDQYENAVPELLTRVILYYQKYIQELERPERVEAKVKELEQENKNAKI